MTIEDLNAIQKKWLAHSNIDWYPSDLKDNLYQALVDIGEGIELCVEVGGNPCNPPLLLIMGLGAQMVFWPDDFIDGLIDAGFFVIRFDNRDIGQSTKIKIRDLKKPPIVKMTARMQVGLSNQHEEVAYNLVDMTHDTYRLIKTLKLDQSFSTTVTKLENVGTRTVNIMGASMGGIISQIFAAQYPSMVDNLVLLFTTTNRPLLLPPKPPQLKALFSSPKSMELQDVINHSMWFVNTIGSPGHVDKEQVKKIAALRYRRSRNQLGAKQQFHAILSTGSVTKYSKQITAPTLVLHGDKDGLLPAQNGHDVARTIKNSEFDLIAGMAHDIPKYYQGYIINKVSKHCLR